MQAERAFREYLSSHKSPSYSAHGVLTCQMQRRHKTERHIALPQSLQDSFTPSCRWQVHAITDRCKIQGRECQGLTVTGLVQGEGYGWH